MYSKYHLNVVLQMFSVKLALPQACSIIFESVCVWGGGGKSKILDKQKQRASSPIIKILNRVVYVVGGGGGLHMRTMYS